MYDSLKSHVQTSGSVHGVKPKRSRSDFYLAARLRDAIRSCVNTWPADNPLRVVDFGCGTMPYFDLLSAKSFEYLGCDLEGTNAPIMFNNGGVVPLPDKIAGRLVSFQVLEHVGDIGWYLREAHRLLDDNGSLVLSTHGVWPYHPHPGDFRRWTRSGLILDLEAHGFDVERVDALVGPGAWTVMFQLAGLGLVLSKLGVLGRGLAAGLNIATSLLLPLIDRITPSEMREANACVYLVVARPR